MSVARVEAIANAVLYEGYALYPYRPSSVKNRRRFNFGVLVPRIVVERADQGYSWHTCTECLVDGDARTVLSIDVRFLQLTPRPASNQAPPRQGDPVADSQSSEPWLDAIERRITLTDGNVAEMAAHREVTRTRFAFDGVEGYAEVSAEPLAIGGFRVRLCVGNTTATDIEAPLAHNDLLPLAFVSTHSILSLVDGEFVSLLEPPERWREAAAACTNVGVYPVLAGEPGRRDVMLSSPIILYDYPQVAVESPGDLFDGAEIDEILTLRILTLTDEEKDEMRRADDRTRQLLERTEALTPEHMMKLHGVMRGVRAHGRRG
jgi:hypothetical protein